MNTLAVKLPSVKNPPPFPPPNFGVISSRLTPLLSLQRWVLWKYENIGGKWTKPPYSPRTHFKFKRDGENECEIFDGARRVFTLHRSKGFTGLGISAELQDGFLYLDFDKCLENGQIKSPELEKFILNLGSYTEVSPSRVGLRVIVKTPQGWGGYNELQKVKDSETPHSCELFGCKGVEAWNNGKYATITGNLFRPELGEIKQNDEVMARFREVMQKGKTAPLPPASPSPAPTPSPTSSSGNRVWTRDEVREMLKHLDPSMGRNDWIKVGKALNDWNSSEGLSAWEEWSRGGSNFIEGECSKVWTAKSWTTKPISVGYLVRQAKQRGWKPQRKEREAIKSESPTEMPDNFPATDSGNAERLARTPEGQKMRFLLDEGVWIYFNGKRYVYDLKGVQCQRFARASIRKALHQFRKNFPEPESKKRQEAEAFCLRSENSVPLNATVSVARTLPEFQIESSELLDADPGLLNTPGCVVNLKTGKKEAHRPELMMTKMTKVEPDFDADCPDWNETIHNATEGNKELREALELFLGMCVTGYAHEVFAIFYGQGSDNLKSTVCETVADLLGDYASTIQSKALQGGRMSDGESASPTIAGLRGKRLVLADEWKEDTKLDEATLKRICSQDTITARMLHSNPISFRPTHSLILRTNHLPKVSATDEGAWKRIYPFPWNYKVPAEKKDEQFRHKMIKKEGRAILAWLCRCAMNFIQRQEQGGKLPRPEPVEALKAQYRSESDILAQWAEVEVEFFPAYFTTNKELRDSIESFAEERGENPKNITHKMMAMFLGKKNCNPDKKNGERGWWGVRLRIPDNPSEGGDGVQRGDF
jgi:putative DNA primase/helicase